MNKKRLTKEQLLLIFIPFLGAIAFLLHKAVFHKEYSRCIIPELAAIGVVFILGLILGIIGLFSYIISLVISLAALGIVYNYIFFKLFNKRSGE